MPSTHLSLHYHLVFSTKNRLPMIVNEWRANLHAYMGGVVRGRQPGYLGVSPSQIESVRGCILDQEKHHRRQTFQEEYLNY